MQLMTEKTHAHTSDVLPLSLPNGYLHLINTIKINLYSSWIELAVKWRISASTMLHCTWIFICDYVCAPKHLGNLYKYMHPSQQVEENVNDLWEEKCFDAKYIQFSYWHYRQSVLATSSTETTSWIAGINTAPLVIAYNNTN